MTDERPEINALIEHYGGRTKDRRRYMTNCVFHDDRTPSMSIDTERQLWKCQSCGQGGDSYTLIKLKEGITDFREQVAFAASLGLAAGSAGGGDEPLRESHYGNSRRSVAGSRDRQARGGYTPAWRRT